MRISISICTWNRSKLLDQTLKQLVSLKIPPGVEIEILVVDNNSTDDTREVIESHSRSLPIRSLYEPKQGLSNARNCAVAAATGDYILWTDDDVLVDPEWLIEYTEGAKRHPDAAFFGGTVQPWFEGTAPKWLSEGLCKVELAYAVRENASLETPCTEENLPFGANLMIKMSYQKGRFYDSDLGRKANSLVGGEEVALLAELLRNDMEGWWIPSARVKHFIPKSRQSTAYLRKYFESHGALMAKNNTVVAPAFLGRPRWVWRSWLVSEFSYFWHRFLTLSPSQKWLPFLRTSSIWRGYLRIHQVQERQTDTPTVSQVNGLDAGKPQPGSNSH